MRYGSVIWFSGGFLMAGHGTSIYGEQKRRTTSLIIYSKLLLHSFVCSRCRFHGWKRRALFVSEVYLARASHNQYIYV